MTSDAERIRRWREALGMSMRDLSERTGLNRETVSAAESGKPTRAANVARILQVLNQIGDAVGMSDPSGPDVQVELEMLLFGVLADHSSDIDWISDVGGELRDALVRSGLLRP